MSETSKGRSEGPHPDGDKVDETLPVSSVPRVDSKLPLSFSDVIDETQRPGTSTEQPEVARLEKLESQDRAKARYVLKGEIGKGGMGAVLKVFDTDLRRSLAMKVILGQQEAVGRLETKKDWDPAVRDTAMAIARSLYEAGIWKLVRGRFFDHVVQDAVLDSFESDVSLDAAVRADAIRVALRRTAFETDLKDVLVRLITAEVTAPSRSKREASRASTESKKNGGSILRRLGERLRAGPITGAKMPMTSLNEFLDLVEPACRKAPNLIFELSEVTFRLLNQRKPNRTILAVLKRLDALHSELGLPDNVPLRLGLVKCHHELGEFDTSARHMTAIRSLFADRTDDPALRKLENRFGGVLNPANGHRYRAISAPHFETWKKVNERAKTATFDGTRGHLATISNRAEGKWIFSSLGDQDLRAFAIGGYAAPGQEWAWVTGEPMRFTNWESGTHPNTSGDKHFMSFGHTDAWIDCQDAFVGYVIEFDEPPDPRTAIRQLEAARRFSGVDFEPSLSSKLETYRTEILPGLASFASIDAAVAARDLETSKTLVEEFRTVAKGEHARCLLAYFEGRILQKEGRHEDAILHHERAIAQDTTRRFEPLLRLTESLRAQGRPIKAAARIMETFQLSKPMANELLERWLDLSLLDLKRSWTETYESLPRTAKYQETGRAGRLLWVLRRLDRPEFSSLEDLRLRRVERAGQIDVEAPVRIETEGLERHPADYEGRWFSTPTEGAVHTFFQNETDFPLRLYWLGFKGERKLHATIPPRSQGSEQSYKNDAWLLASDVDFVFGTFVVGSEDAKLTIKPLATESR